MYFSEETTALKFTIGYQQPESGERFSSIISDYRSKVSEVYFPWIGTASGRPVLGNSHGETDRDAQCILEEELRDLRRLGVKLDLLFNANCYGERAISKSLENEICSIIAHLDDIDCRPDIVTTTSLMIARTVKKYFSGTEVRASVNMRIGTTQAMGYVEELFDSFYLRRDLQRNIEYVKKVRRWCDRHGKKLCLLANSGCLRYCPGQTFHDNLIAHSSKAEEMNNVSDWNPHVCRNLYHNPENYVEILKSTWIRPEDLSLYEGIVDTIKLATRQHSHPRMVIGAYGDGNFRGNLLDLLEPGFSAIFSPNYIDNAAFPSQWAACIGTCTGNCDSCRYCNHVLKQVLKSL